MVLIKKCDEKRIFFYLIFFKIIDIFHLENMYFFSIAYCTKMCEKYVKYMNV